MTYQYYLQVLASLAFLGLILWGVYTFSQTYKKKLFSGNLKIKDRLFLDKNVSIAVVEYKQTEYLVSVADKSLTLIKEFPLSPE